MLGALRTDSISRSQPGYETELGGGSPSLNYDLPNGQKWKKKIWPRAYYPRQLGRWNSVENPDLIMVHYLEHSGNNQETDCLQITEEERKTLAPANLDFLTLSDRSLCSLLNMASSADDAVALMRQLSVILHQNILKFRTIVEMVEASNAVLPFVKSSSIACKPSEQAPPPAAADPSGVGVQATPIVRKALSSTVAAVDTSTPSGLSLNPHILSQMLASNLLVFYQGDRTLNCIALNPVYNKPATSSPATSSPATFSPATSSLATTRQDIADESPVQSTQESSANHSDYDANKFTQFANALIQMNPLDSLQGLAANEDARKIRTGQTSGIGWCPSAPALTGCKDRGTPRGKSLEINSGQSSTLSQELSPLSDLTSHMDLHFDEGSVETRPLVATTVTAAQGSAWAKELSFPWALADPDTLQYASPQIPAIELPECGVNNVPLTSLWNPHPLDNDPLHSWLRASDETDESGADSCASCSHPSDAHYIELPQEVETLVSSSEFFQTSCLLAGHEDSGLKQPGELTSSALEREERCDWEMDFSLQGNSGPGSSTNGTSTYPSQTIFSNFFLRHPCSESQSLFSFNQDSAELGRDNSSSPFPSSSSVESESTHSNISIHDPIFETMDSPSVAELCEMLGESQNVQHCDFAHMTLTENEHQQLLDAAKIIQNAFRKYRCRRQMRAREKRAALLIERYYKRYKEIKKRHEQTNRNV
eukprot:Em0008g1253a